eukprot:513959_1
MMSIFTFVIVFIVNGIAKRMDIEDITVVNVTGSHYEMGVEYGYLLENELNMSLNILFDYFMNQNGMTYQQLVQQSELFYDRYSYTFNFFLQGISVGSGLSFTDCKILNAMETLHATSNQSSNNNYGLPSCAFVSLPPSICANNATLIGRNYDFPAPFNEIAKNLVVTIIHETNKIPTAIIGLPGQIYCPSCINKEGIFMELNNGEPSGGFTVIQERQTLLIKLLETLQNSYSMNDVVMQMNSFQSDYSLIINTNDAKCNGQSFEYSSTLGMKPFYFVNNQSFVSTNFFLNNTWENIPPPTDNTTWNGVTRRNNLLNLTSSLKQYDSNDLLDIMNVTLENGGALWNLTIYQIVFDSSTFSLFLRNTLNSHQNNWTHIPLNELW